MSPRPEPGVDRWPGEPGLGGWYTDEEQAALVRVLQEMPSWTSGYSRRHQEAFEHAFAAAVGAGDAVSVNSGGAGLDIAMACLDAPRGAEVISCAVNFPGTPLAVLGAGLRLVLAEPDPFTLNLDPAEIPRRMTPRTVAILVTHMNGDPADVPAIVEATVDQARRLRMRPPRIVVDAARAIGATTPVGPVGTGAWITMFSFHRKKAITTLGEGGMLTTDCPTTAHRIRQIRSFGLGRAWGSSHRMTEFQAAVGVVQLGRLEDMTRRRVALGRERTVLLSGVSGVRPPQERTGFRHVYYLYNVLMEPRAGAGARDRIMAKLRAEHGIGTVIANHPTYQAHPLIAEHVRDQGRFPVADEVTGHLLCLPVHPLMTSADNAAIAEAVARSVADLGLG
ncbi:MAG: aminotransferase class I/II-fold pyridoxal phosphate-dependent enzyme [Actinomycetota bacterium]|nr:aminotransferase class I/II-fold pyridoxal phosphate-dependent enzyme [Actinomycetota bacterium]